jgi:hypothetical protein
LADLTPVFSPSRKTFIKLAAAVAFAACLLANTSTARASEVELIRLTCIPASGYFRVDFLSLDHRDLGAYEQGPNDTHRIMQSWHKQGIYEVDALRRDCALPGTRYQVRVRRDSYKQDGQCAQKPRVNFTLLRNGLPVLKDVPYGDDCYIGVGVTQMVINETPGATSIQLCFGTPSSDGAHCTQLDDAYKTIGRRGAAPHPPMDQSAFEEIVERLR